MSTNDNSASRRGRRVDQGERRGPARQERDERWEQSSSRDRTAANGYPDQAPRDGQFQRAAYSNFSRHSYPPQEPAPKQPHSNYPEPPARNEPPRYAEPAAPSYAPHQPLAYEPEPPHLNYDGGRDDLFAPNSAASGYEQGGYGAQVGGYTADPYEQSRGHHPMTQPALGRREDIQFAPREPAPSPIDDYERNFSARIAEEAAASRFYLPEDEPQKARAQQQDRAYQPPQPASQYAANAYAPQEAYGARYSGEESWAEESLLQEEERGAGAVQPSGLGHELDEDFFADEEDFEHDQLPAPKRGRKKLIAAALAGAIAVGAGGAYFYSKSVGGGGEAGTPILRADTRPLKQPPENPGGKQFPNGEKTIYDRLTPDGQQIQTASMASPPMAAAPPQPFTTSTSGNSLEERIDEALRKAQRGGETPQASAPPPGAEHR